ncbi:exodeoxyribonuclease V subunit gamma [Alkalimonas sp. MEB108]|uniref:RecBCD enzyme subunit RecC n=1 Tax=Alkalimonas cellulosilytica TaxID=3058395 RepID=A0ABU7JA37_9GAMM|nr:exodeoxyribonuclease V subunit gamma [Alkalimonas sp. MEB108]MEE2003075.1 exodeoxyribonuclease V subunit gamma [Alkalimonas sp. MEB108]
MADQDWPTGFMVLQGNRLEQLRDVMLQWCQRYPLAPLETETFLVQSNGIAQWLKLALAAPKAQGGLGIAAGICTELPGRFLWQAYRAVLPALPAESPYNKDALGWRLYRLLQQLPELSELAPLHGFLAKDPTDARRCYQLAFQLADLFDQYQVYRADWLQQWQQGNDSIDGHPLPAHQLWQPWLWRQLQQEIQSQQPTALSRADVHQQFLTACQQLQARPAGLPRRVVVFGISSLPRQTLDALHALSPFCQVLLFVSNPCQQYWGDLIDGRDLLRQEYRRARRPDQHPLAQLSAEQLHLAGNPLLAALGKQGRDYLHLLDELDDSGRYQQYFAGRIDLFESPGEDSLLQQLQQDILELRSAEERANMKTQVPVSDRSLQFMRCHSPLRELEVLHDQLLHELSQASEQGQSLTPRDILVMVPDINQYAPYIAATFGRFRPEDPRYLPYFVADQGLRHRNSLLLAFETLLRLPDNRFTVSAMLDLLDTSALQQRFGLDEAGVARLKPWIEGANIRWGLSGQQRAAFGLPEQLEQNSWWFGLKRMLLGYVVGEGEAWQDIEPYDEVAGLDAALVGPLAELVHALEHSWQQLQQPHNAADWQQLLLMLLEQFFVPQSPADQQADARIRQQLSRFLQHLADSGLAEQPLALEVVRDALLSELDQPSLQQRFLAGAVNFATLMPMRAIPFGQIWLLGMNDGDYPRPVRRNDFDLMQAGYRPGDRSRRDDDHYLFLEALQAARHKLVLSWVGFSIRDNSEKPPSVLVGQLRDYLETAYPEQKLLQQLTVDHPLQPFSRRYFEPTRDPRLFSYAEDWRAALEPGMAQAEDTAPPGFPLEATHIRLSDLASFLRHPARVLYQKRLGIYTGFEADSERDDELFAAGGLDGWVLDQALIARLEQGLSAGSTSQGQPLTTEQLLQQETTRLQRAGALPMAGFGDLLMQQKNQQLAPLLQQWQQLQLQSVPYGDTLYWQQMLDETLPVVFEDSLSDIRQHQDGRLLRLMVQPSRLFDAKQQLKSYHLCRFWPAHLLAQQAGAVETLLIGPDAIFRLPPLDQAQALQLFNQLLDAYLQALQRPLPLACKTMLAFFGGDEKAAIQSYEGSDFQGDYAITAEVRDYPLLQRYWPDFEQLSTDADFAALGEALYAPLLQQLALGGSQ